MKLPGFLRRRKAPRLAVDWLDARTGHSAEWWMLLIQGLIAAEWRPNPDDPDHPISHPRVWIDDLASEVERCRPGGAGDENLWMATTLGAILCAWGSRCSRAKAHDPRRPVELRRFAAVKHDAFIRGLVGVVASDRFDSAVFDQPWEDPWDEDATDGDFV